MAVVDRERIVRYQYHQCDKSLLIQWSLPTSGRGLDSLSVDGNGNILASDYYEPAFWISPRGDSTVDVQYEKQEDGVFNFDESSFHAKCLNDWLERPSGGALALPSGDIVFVQGLVMPSNISGDDHVYLGVLRKGERKISAVHVRGITRADIGADRGVSWKCCVGPRGDVFVAAIEPSPRLFYISDPTQSECHGSWTTLKGFRAFEEFEGICVDGGYCVYLLVVCNWPSEREIYFVNPVHPYDFEYMYRIAMFKFSYSK